MSEKYIPEVGDTVFIMMECKRFRTCTGKTCNNMTCPSYILDPREVIIEAVDKKSRRISHVLVFLPLMI